MDSLRDFGIELNLNQMFDLVNDPSNADQSYAKQPEIIEVTPSSPTENSHQNEFAHHSASHQHKEGVF